VRGTVAAFQRAGARCELRVYDDEEHGVNDDEAAAVRGLLLSLLEDGRSPSVRRRPEADGPHQSAGLDAPRR